MVTYGDVWVIVWVDIGTDGMEALRDTIVARYLQAFPAYDADVDKVC